MEPRFVSHTQTHTIKSFLRRGSNVPPEKGGGERFDPYSRKMETFLREMKVCGSSHGGAEASKGGKDKEFAWEKQVLVHPQRGDFGKEIIAQHHGYCEGHGVVFHNPKQNFIPIINQLQVYLQENSNSDYLAWSILILHTFLQVTFPLGKKGF